MREPAYYRVATPLGEMRVYVADGRPLFVTLPGRGESGEEARAPAPAAVAELIAAVKAFFRGEEVSSRYASELIACLGTTVFERAVLEEVSRIPRGETRSYGEVAELAGYPRAARAVGNVMHDNPYPIVVPCHRVIRGDGGIGGYGGAEEIKAWLLRFEGCEPGE
ncbi:MAG: MGMT family protein [Actinomycetota bacterium]|nr:MGMT family protein [Actinomycetota bacterium]MDD5665777.1 MGMT family protein [Actinomycetota bacterium]